MRKPAELLGQKFGTRTVVERLKNTSTGAVRWRMLCDCGAESILGSADANRAGRCRACFWSLEGKKFGKRLVLSLDRVTGLKPDLHRYWKVRCDCGNEFVCETQYLKKTADNPCRKCSPGLKAPRPHKRKRPFETQYNAWVHRARYPVSVTYEQFLELTEIKECHYCGSEIVWTEYNMTRKGTSASNIDRKDSFKPYDLDNIVVCCCRCNMGKNSLFSHEEWLEIGAVIRFWGNRKVPYFNGHSSRRQNNWRIGTGAEDDVSPVCSCSSDTNRPDCVVHGV